MLFDDCSQTLVLNLPFGCFSFYISVVLWVVYFFLRCDFVDSCVAASLFSKEEVSFFFFAENGRLQVLAAGER